MGLGYVGLPVALAFGQYSQVIGFDINHQRIAELNQGIDRTQELSAEAFQNNHIQFTTEAADLHQADFHIIAVPTPIDAHKHPDLLPVLKASKTLGKYLKVGDIVVYESTVYPGATEEMCIPVLERHSGLRCGTDFSVGYSPERINPGDHHHTLTQITKVISAQDPASLEIIAQVYASIIHAGVYRAPSIRVAETAKVIENIQRDVNIALMNELAMILKRLDIDTHAVLAAAATKWNFLTFTPGLVGGHCIGVDPYYLQHKAEQVGYEPQVIPAARRINEGMGHFIGQQMLTQLIHQGYLLPETTVTLLGLAFKENVRDLRNTRVIDIIQVLKQNGVQVQVHDPLVDAQEVWQEHQLVLQTEPLPVAQGIILAVAHHYYIQRGWPWLEQLLEHHSGIVFDVKGVLPLAEQPEHIVLWRL